MNSNQFRSTLFLVSVTVNIVSRAWTPTSSNGKKKLFFKGGNLGKGEGGADRGKNRHSWAGQGSPDLTWPHLGPRVPPSMHQEKCCIAWYSSLGLWDCWEQETGYTHTSYINESMERRHTLKNLKHLTSRALTLLLFPVFEWKIWKSSDF